MTRPSSACNTDSWSTKSTEKCPGSSLPHWRLNSGPHAARRSGTPAYTGKPIMLCCCARLLRTDSWILCSSLSNMWRHALITKTSLRQPPRLLVGVIEATVNTVAAYSRGGGRETSRHLVEHVGPRGELRDQISSSFSPYLLEIHDPGILSVHSYVS